LDVVPHTQSHGRVMRLMQAVMVSLHQFIKVLTGRC